MDEKNYDVKEGRVSRLHHVKYAESRDMEIQQGVIVTLKVTWTIKDEIIA